MSETSPSITLHLARAYGASAPSGTGPLAGLSAGRRAIVPSAARATPLRQAVQRLPSPTLSRLVAAQVPGGIDFTSGTPAPSAPATALAFYRHPADKNAAATAVTAGRVLDTTA